MLNTELNFLEKYCQLLSRGWKGRKSFQSNRFQIFQLHSCYTNISSSSYFFLGNYKEIWWLSYFKAYIRESIVINKLYLKSQNWSASTGFLHSLAAGLPAWPLSFAKPHDNTLGCCENQRLHNKAPITEQTGDTICRSGSSRFSHHCTSSTREGDGIAQKGRNNNEQILY